MLRPPTRSLPSLARSEGLGSRPGCYSVWGYGASSLWLSVISVSLYINITYIYIYIYTYIYIYIYTHILSYKYVSLSLFIPKSLVDGLLGFETHGKGCTGSVLWRLWVQVLEG